MKQSLSLFLVSFFCVFLPVKSETRIFLLDNSGSMFGKGYELATYGDVFNKAKESLATHIESLPDSINVIVTPFCRHLGQQITGTNSEIAKNVLSLDYIIGESDISQSWKEAQDMKTTGRKIYFLITDGFDNVGYMDDMETYADYYSSKATDDEITYYYLVSDRQKDSNLAQKFIDLPHLDVTNTFDVNPFCTSVPEKTVLTPTIEEKTTAEQTAESSFSLWWLLLLLIILIIFLIPNFLKRSDKAGVKSANKNAEKNVVKASEKNAVKIMVNGVLTEIPRGKEALAVVREGDKYIPAINNINEYSYKYPAEFNKQLFQNRRNALTYSNQFISAKDLSKTQSTGNLTEKASRYILRKNLINRMDPENAKIIEAFGGTQAHHVVEGTDAHAANSRKVLKKYGIGINDAENGVFLPENDDDCIFKGTIHKTSHSKEYSEYVYSKIKNVKSREELILKLTEIKKELVDGTLDYLAK